MPEEPGRRSTQRAFLRNDRNDTLIEHIHHHLHQQRTNAGHTAAQSVGTQQHHTADNLFGIRVTGSGAVAEDEVGGQGVGHLFGNSDAGKITKAGGDAVSNTFFAGNFFCQLTGTLHLSQSLLETLTLRQNVQRQERFRWSGCDRR